MSEAPSLASLHPIPVQGFELPGAPTVTQAAQPLPPPTSSQVVATVPMPSSLDVVELLDQPVRTTFTFPASSVHVTCTAPLGAPDITTVFGAVAFLTSFSCSADGSIRLTVRVAFTVLGTDGNVRICQSDQVFEGSVGPGIDCTLSVPPATSVTGLAQTGPRTVEARLEVGSFQVTIGQRRSIRVILAPGA